MFLSKYSSSILVLTILLALFSCTKNNNSDCTNNIMDGNEQGIDCGGNCPECATCDDGIKNQNEVDVDCGGECAPCDIIYPETGIYGLNLLYGSDTLYLPGTGNSFKAIIPEGSSLKVKLTLLEGVKWGYAVGTGIGWSVSTYANYSQTFDAINGGTVEVKIAKWSGSESGTILIEFFENSNEATRQKILIWE